MAQCKTFQDLEGTGKALIDFFDSSEVEELKQVKLEHQAFFDKHIETRNLVTQILQDMVQTEESVSQKLLDTEEAVKIRAEELENLEEQLSQCTAKSQIADSEIQFLRKELDNLKSTEHELETLQHEVDEDTTEVIPSAVYVAQLYHLITKIKWEYETQPGILKGVHYGPDLATPINIDTSARSRSDVSDRLWSFVSTDW
uniref:Kinetochore protein Spc24 n=1 Tax=Nothobranchius korthausae TaxID=1143690 RepID=A0A1A8HN38_9TELE